MQTTDKNAELTGVIIKMTIVAALFLAGFFLNYLESVSI